MNEIELKTKEVSLVIAAMRGNEQMANPTKTPNLNTALCECLERCFFAFMSGDPFPKTLTIYLFRVLMNQFIPA